MTKLDMCDPCLALPEPMLSVAKSHGRTVINGSPIKFCGDHKSVWKEVNMNRDKVNDLLDNARKGANSLIRKAVGK